jgi:hypothetical protein
MSEYVGLHRNVTEEELFRALFKDIQLSKGDDVAYEMLESLDPDAYEWAVKALFQD